MDQSTVGPWPTSPPAAAAVAMVKCPPPSLPPIDNLTIDNMDDLPTFDPHSGTADDVAQLSKTLIEFLLTRRVNPAHDHAPRALSLEWTLRIIRYSYTQS